MIKKFIHWLLDYFYAIYVIGKTFILRVEPRHYLEHIVEAKVPIILIPGIFEKWHFLKYFADALSELGHPIYILNHLGYNRKEISHSAQIVREFIEEKELKNIIILAHSKGGLIGKELLLHHNNDMRVINLIAVASPFRGSKIARGMPVRALRELAPGGHILEKQNIQTGVNQKIISIYGSFDNHIWPGDSSHLENAENIQVTIYGHHKILANKKVRKIILDKVEKISNQQSKIPHKVGF